MTERELNDLLADIGSNMRVSILSLPRGGVELQLVTPEGQVALRAKGKEMIRRFEVATQTLWMRRLTNRHGAPGVPKGTFGD